MRSLVAVALAALPHSFPVMAQADPVAVARAFVEAIIRGEVAAIRSQHTDDALVVVGDVGAPLSGVEGALIRPEMKLCAVSPLNITTESLAADSFGPKMPASIKEKGTRIVEGTMSCPTTGGATKNTTIRVIVAGNKVAAIAFY